MGHVRIRPLAVWLVVCATTLAASTPSESDAPHGAADMNRQQELLSKLLEGRDVTAPPAGVDPILWGAMIPEDNAMTPERVALGQKLYFDTRLSADGTVSCATCHDVTRGFTDQRNVAEGIHDQLGRRNSPTTLNSGLMDTLFWDGRADSLEHQAGMPILNPIEMGQPDRESVEQLLSGIPEYTEAFSAAYGRSPNYPDLERALAAFERTLVFVDAPFDRFLTGETDAISESAARGWDLFNGKARCASCHPIHSSNPLGTDNRFHNIGVAARNHDFEALAKQALVALDKDDSEEELDRLALSTDMSELGRFMVTKNYADIGAFRSLQLRNVGITGPYMHDGSLQTLWDVIDHYNKGGEPNLYLDGGIEPLALTEDEIDDLVAFLFSLTDDRLADQNDSQHSAQKTRATEVRPIRETDVAMRKVFAWERRLTEQGE